MNNLDDYVISHIRTFVPVAIGALVAWLASKDLRLDGPTTDGLIAFLTGSVTVLYYALVRILEQSVSAKFGWLLGFAKKPDYNALTNQAPSGK